MKAYWAAVIVLCAVHGLAQNEDGEASAYIRTLPIEEGRVTVLHLAPQYITSVKLPEEISSIVVGDPATFKAEHSEAEPHLVFFKPVSDRPGESNALITTKSGQAINLRLRSAGTSAGNNPVDFLVEYRPPTGLLIGATADLGFSIAETLAATRIASGGAAVTSSPRALIAQELENQRSVSAPDWRGSKGVVAAIGHSVVREHQTILGFSVLNGSNRTIELLAPQIELSGASRGRGSKRIKAEPVTVSEYRMTTRNLAPGQRADGVVVFERPAFKASTETLQLQLAEAERVDSPILLPLPFAGGDE